MARSGFSLAEAQAAFDTTSNRATDRIRVAVPKIIVQFTVNPWLACAEAERAARQIEAGVIPHDANWPAVRLVQMLQADVRRTMTEIVTCPAWSEADIERLQRQRGNVHLPWLKR